MSSTVIPGLRYHDAARAVDWLCDAFGFDKHLVVPGAGGRIEHAQLSHGSGMVMLGSVGDDEFGRLVATAVETGRPTGGIYVIVPDVEAHAERARAAGAEIVMEPEEQDYGGSNYTCRDFEQNIWSFGDYDPWAR